MQSQPPDEPGRGCRNRTLIVLAVVAAAGIFGVSLIAVLSWKAARTVERAGEGVAELADRFRTETITTRFLASLPETESAGLGNLELATSTVTEVFTRSDDRRILWDRVSVGETVVEIRVPVTYRYHVRLADDWKIEVTGSTCLVHAPELRPSQPPAIHTDRMEKRSYTRGWWAEDADEHLEALERELTPLLEDYAGDPRHLAAVRDACRNTVAAFVRAWLLYEGHWQEDQLRAIVVRFADEVPPERHARPTLSIED